MDALFVVPIGCPLELVVPVTSNNISSRLIDLAVSILLIGL
jgi:hypothetical protein